MKGCPLIAAHSHEQNCAQRCVRVCVARIFGASGRKPQGRQPTMHVATPCLHRAGRGWVSRELSHVAADALRGSAQPSRPFLQTRRQRRGPHTRTSWPGQGRRRLTALFAGGAVGGNAAGVEWSAERPQSPAPVSAVKLAYSGRLNANMGEAGRAPG